MRNNQSTAPHVRLSDHIFRDSGSCKTVCVTAAITSFGVPVDAFNSTSTKKNVNAYEGVLRRNGFALRSRKSSVGKNPTVGGIRKRLQGLGDPEGTRYLIMVWGHVLVLDRDGNTIVDTAPRRADRRKVVRIHAVWPK